MKEAEASITPLMRKDGQTSIYRKNGTTDYFMVGYEPIISMEYNQYNNFTCVQMPNPENGCKMFALSYR